MTRYALAYGLIVGIATLAGVETASAATCVWQGGGNPKWSTPTNWLCAGNVNRAPVNGDSLTFPATALTFTSTNDIAGLQPASIAISSPRYIINGVGISLPAGTIQFNGPFYSNAVHGSQFLVPVTMTGALDVVNNSPDQQDLWLGDVNLNGFELTFDIFGTNVIHELGVISGNGRISKVDPGTLQIETDATFTGRLTVNTGTVETRTAHALGASGPGNETVVASQTFLSVIETGTMTIDESIVFTGDGGHLVVEDPISTGLTVTFTGPVTGPTDSTLLNTVTAEGTGDRIVMSGPVKGGAFQTNGVGVITFTNPADAWSTLRISNATVRPGAAGVLPANGDIIIVTTGTLDLNGFDASIGMLSADNGLVSLGAANLTVTVPNPRMGFVGAAITGTGTFTKSGPGTLQLNDFPNAVFNGPMVVTDGQLVLANAAGKNILAGPITVNGGGALVNGYDNQIGDLTSVTVNVPASWQLSDHVDVVGSLAGSGTVFLGKGKILVGGNNASTTFSGAIVGSADPQGKPVVKQGSGTLTLTGQSTYTGITSIDGGGTLAVNGSLLATGTVDIGTSTIAGTGSIGDIIGRDGVISPGNSPGILHAAMAHINPNTRLVIELNGLAAGSGYDQLDVTGNVVLSPGCLLNVNSHIGVPRGSQFTIVNVAAGHTVTGTFDNLPEGGTLGSNQQDFSITYKGGDGNDVVLTAVTNPPAVTYYLSEGATGAFFDEDVLIANPNGTDAPVTLTFSKEDGSQVTTTQTIPAQAHATVHVDKIAGLEATSASAQVRSERGLPLIVERTMFWDTSYYAGHTGSAVDQPATDWFFAEGSQGFFSTFVLVINPNATPTDVTFTFLREAETPVTKTITVGASTRLTLDAGTVPEIVNRSFGITVHATQPIMAERSMYFGTRADGRLWSGGTESAGVTTLSTHWFLAEGATGGFFDTFILLSNPNNTAANVTLQYLLPSGDTISVPKVVPPNARLTTNIETEADLRLHNAAVSTVVTSDQPIIAERSMYWPGAAVPWGEGHNSFGVVDAGLHWGLAEGRTGGLLNFHTYILLANPQSTAANVTVSLLRETGAPVVKTFIVPPTSRFNIDIGTITELQNEGFGADIQVTNAVPIIVERSMYWDSNGFQFSGGTNATGSRLP